MEDIAYQVYLDTVKEFLEVRKVRLLIEKEEEIVVAHLKVVSATYCLKHSSKRNDADVYEGLGITQVLAIETAKKVSEIHPDFPTATQEETDQRVAEVLAVRNYLSEGGVEPKMSEEA